MWARSREIHIIQIHILHTQFIHLNWGWGEDGKIVFHNIHVDGKDIWAEANAAEAAGSD